MSRRIYCIVSQKFIGIALVLGVLCAPSCTKEIGNVETEYFYGDHEGESLVLGRIGVVEEGIERSWISPRKNPTTETSFQIFIRGKESESRVSHYLQGDGFFCVRLPTGDYALWKWIYRFPGGRAITIEPLPIYFHVLPGKHTYIGTLYIYFPPISPMPRRSLGAKRPKPRYEIVDEYRPAMAFWKNHYPRFPRSVERNLMHFSR